MADPLDKAVPLTRRDVRAGVAWGVAVLDAHGRASRLLDLARVDAYNPGNASDPPTHSDYANALADRADDRIAGSAEYRVR